jgi:hypothetical protein
MTTGSPERQRPIKYPRADGQEIVGLPAEFVFLEIINTAKPVHEPLIEELQRSEAIDIDAGTITISWSVAAKPKFQLREEIRELENQKNDALIGRDNVQKLLILGMGVLMRQAGDAGLNNVEKQIRLRVIGLATKVYTNEANKQAMIDAVNAGTRFDIHAGWEDV